MYYILDFQPDWFQMPSSPSASLRLRWAIVCIAYSDMTLYWDKDWPRKYSVKKSPSPIIYSEIFITLQCSQAENIHFILRALLTLTFDNQILAKFDYRLRVTATTLTSVVIYIPSGNVIYISAWATVAYPIYRQCEKPDYRISEIQSSRPFCILIFPIEDWWSIYIAWKTKLRKAIF